LADTLLQKVGNGTLFNLSWLAIVTTGSVTIAAAVVTLHLIVHQFWLGHGRRELLFIAAVSLFGLALDQLLFALGLFTLDGKAALAPLWLTCLWPVLATTLQHAFAGLQQHLLLAGVLGGIGGYGSYLAGTKLSAVTFADPALGPFIVGAIWVLLFPALALAARYWFSDVSRGNGSQQDENSDDKGEPQPA
jgi:hypothetical protein